MRSIDTTRVDEYLDEMLRLQDEVNTLIDAGWRDNGNKWYRAIWVECAELMDHVGWKWWKRQSMNIPQVRLELVDIWHFALSEILQDGLSDLDMGSLRARLSDLDRDEVGREEEILISIERLASSALSNRKFDALSFCDAATAAGLSLDELYRTYVGKNVLNKFRQDHGYKTGGYQKIWSGREDNEWLAELASRLTPTDNFSTSLYSSLSKAYKQFSGEMEPR